MLNQYETVFIVTPVLSEAQMKEAVEKVRKILTDNGGEIVHHADWGLRKMAYPIKNKSTGFYNHFEFKAPGELISKLETEYKRDERFLRFLTFRMDKYAVEYSEKRRSVNKEVKQEE